MTDKNQPSLLADRRGDNVQNALTSDRGVLELTTLQCSKIDHSDVHTGPERSARVEVRFKTLLSAKRQIAIRIGEIAQDKIVMDFL